MESAWSRNKRFNTIAASDDDHDIMENCSDADKHHVDTDNQLLHETEIKIYFKFGSMKTNNTPLIL